MKVVVFGAAGGTGKRLVERALASGHAVVAVARRPEAIEQKHEHLQVAKGDVLDRKSVALAIEGADAVIATFGPANNRKPGTLMSNGVENIVAACEDLDIPRFVFESGLMCSDGKGLSFFGRIGLGLVGWWYSAMRDDKRIAERTIAASKIPHWVIVRPPVLDDSSATGDYVHGVDAPLNPAKALAHADVAAFLVRAATDDSLAKTIQAIGHD